MNWKDLFVRIFKTFIQGFLGALAVTLQTSDLQDEAIIKSLLIGALAGGFSAVMNVVIQILDNKKGE